MLRNLCRAEIILLLTVGTVSLFGKSLFNCFFSYFMLTMIYFYVCFVLFKHKINDCLYIKIKIKIIYFLCICETSKTFSYIYITRSIRLLLRHSNHHTYFFVWIYLSSPVWRVTYDTKQRNNVFPALKCFSSKMKSFQINTKRFVYHFHKAWITSYSCRRENGHFIKRRTFICV